MQESACRLGVVKGDRSVLQIVGVSAVFWAVGQTAKNQQADGVRTSHVSILSLYRRPYCNPHARRDPIESAS
jgi:hypothetical protein